MIRAIVSDLNKTLVFDETENSTKRLNEELLKHLIRYSSIVDLFIFTASSHQDIQSMKIDINKHFQKIITIDDLNTQSKKDSRAYEALCREIKLFPNEILFVDDSEKNCETAQSIGIKSLMYKDVVETDEWINSFLG